MLKAGQAVLAFMLAEKIQGSCNLDLDDATTTSIKQLADRKQVSFLYPTTNRIDRGAFNGLFESVIGANKELFIADLGASGAEQLPKYFAMNGVDVIMAVHASNIQLQIVCVIGGGNIFKATMEHLDEIVNICIKSGWLDRDPFVGFKMTKREVERPFLVEEELNTNFEDIVYVLDSRLNIVDEIRSAPTNVRDYSKER